VLLVAVVAAIAIAVHLFDPRSLGESMAASVKAGTGRELSFGEVGIELLPRPALVLSKVRFANAAWGSQPWMVQAGRVTAGIDAAALLSGRLHIRRLAVTDASVILETYRDGTGNWVIGSADAGASAWLETLEIDELALQGVAYTYRDGATGRTASAQLDSARIAGAAPHPIILSARVTFDGRSVDVAGTIGSLAALIANEPGYPVDLEARVGAASVTVHGAIDEPHGLAGLKLALRVQAAELAELAALFGVTVPPLGPFRGAAQLTGAAAAPVFSGIDVEIGAPGEMGLTARGDLRGSLSTSGHHKWQATGMEVTIGGRGMPEIKLRGAVADLRAASGIDLQLTASASAWWRPGAAADGPRLPPFHARARLRDARQGYLVDDLEVAIAGNTLSASLQVAQVERRLRITGKAASPVIDLTRRPLGTGGGKASAAVAGSPRPAEYWKLADVDLDLKIGRLVLPDGRQLQNGSGRLALDNGEVKAVALRATLGGANVTLDGRIADPQNLAGLDLGVALQGSELAEFFKFFGKAIPPVGPYQGRARLHGALDAVGVSGIDASAGRPGQRLHVTGQIEDAIKRHGIQLAITAEVNDSTAAGRLFGADLPRLPALRATARVAGPQDGYVFDDLTLALGRTSVRGRAVFAPGEPRPRVTAKLSGPLVDLSALPPARVKPGGPNPLLATDLDADIRFDRVVLRDRRALGPVSGGVRLAAGAVELKQLTVAVEGASATLDGRIDDPLTPAALDLMVSARVTHGAGLAAFTGLRLQSLPGFTASGKLTDGPGGYALTGLKLVGEATTVAGDIAVARGARRLKVSAKGSSPLLDLSAFMRPAAAGGVAKPAAGTRAIPDVPLPLDVLRVVDADLELRIDAVKLGAADPLGPLLVRAAIADGRLEVGPVQLAGRAGQMLNLSGTVNAAQSAWALRIDGAGINLGELLARSGHPGLATGGSIDLSLQFQGHGKSLPVILGSLNGDARVNIGPHRVNNFSVNPTVLSRIFSLASPAEKADSHTDVKCIAARLPIRNGVMTSEGNVAAETAKYNAVVSGAVNLRTEAIDVAVTPIVTSGVGIGDVRTIVRLRGTLAAPTVSVDPVGIAVRSAASIGVAVTTLGGSLVADALLKKALSDPNPCGTALAQR